MRICLLIAVCVVAMPPGLVAQTGEPLRLDGRRLPLQTDTFAIYLIQGTDTLRTGTLVDALHAEGNRVVRVYEQSDRVLGPQLDTIVSQLPQLLPVSYSTRSAQMVARLTFTATDVSGWTRLPNGDSVGLQVSLPNTVYDGTSYDLVVRASDLAEGLELTVPAFVVGPNTVASITGRVTGIALVDGHACWTFTGNFAGMPVTFWIDKETRALRRQLMQPRVDIGILFAAPRRKTGSRAT